MCFYGGLIMNFDFYKPYLKPLFGWPSITEVDKLLSDIFEYNSDISKILNIDGLINIDYQKHDDNDIPYIFKNGFNIFYVDEVKDGYFEMIMDFNLFLEVYICSKCLYHELESELYDSILDYFKWCIKVNYIECSFKQSPRVLGLMYATSSTGDPDMESLYETIESIISANIKYTAYKDCKEPPVESLYKSAVSITNSNQPDWYCLIIDNWSDIYNAIKHRYIDSSWYQSIVKIARYSDINPLVITPEETFESLDGISHVLGCILCRIHYNEIMQSYINALPELSERDFKYYKLEKGIEWVSDEEPIQPNPNENDIHIKLSYDDTIDSDLKKQFPFLRKIPLNVARAFEYVWKYNTEGSDHKQWVIDQMLQKLLTDDEYNQYIKAYIKWYNNDHEEKATEEDLSQEIHGVSP